MLEQVSTTQRGAMRTEEPAFGAAHPSQRRKPRTPLRELVGSSDLAELTLLDCQDARFWYPWHFHPEVEIKLVMSGSGTRYIGESIAPFEPGDLCIVGAGTPHCWSSKPVRGHWVRARVAQFLPDRFGDFAGLLSRAKLGIELHGGAREEARAEIERMFATSSPVRRIAHLHVLLAIAAEAGEARVLGAPKTVSQERRAERSLAQEVCEYLMDHAVAPLSQSDVARRFGMSAAGFSRFFAREFGKPFVRYRAELRVGHASHLLVEQELSIAEIAAASGFGTVASLDRHFRATKGTTPTAYRQLARSMNHR